MAKTSIAYPSARQLQQAGYTYDWRIKKWSKVGKEWAGEPVEAYPQAPTGEDYLARIESLQKEFGGQIYPEAVVPALVKEPAQPIQPAPELLTEPEISLPEGWVLDEAGNAVSPDGWKVTPNQTYVDPEGREYTEAQIKESHEVADQLTALFPEQDIQQLVQWGEDDPQKFVDEFRGVGDNAASRAVLKRLGMSDEDIDAIFYPEAQPPESPFELLGAAWQNFVNTKILARPANVNFNPERGNSLSDLWHFPGRLLEWLAPTKIGATLGVVGAFFENVVQRPWEATVMLAADGLAAALEKGIEGTDRIASQSNLVLAKSFDKYGVGGFFSDEVAESWKLYKGELPEYAEKVAEAEEWLNPAFFVPIGEGLGTAAKFTSKIPLIGNALKYSAAGVQAIEKGMAYPVVKPLQAGLRGLEEVGMRLGEDAAGRLLRGSAHLEDIMDLPTTEAILDAALTDNWQRRTLQALTKLPGVKAGIEKGLGWRMLTTRYGEEVLGAVGRGAIVHSEMSRRGVNAAAAKVLEFRSVVSNPVKYFGFDENAISARMAERINPYFRGSPEAGTLEHIFAKPELYNWAGMEDGLRYVRRFQEAQDAMLSLLVKEGVPPENVIEDWIHRLVMDTGKVKGAPKVGRGGGRIGARMAYERPRRFETMADGIQYFISHPELGKAYANNPELLIRDYITQAFKKIADTRFEQYVAPWGVTIKEIMAYRFPEEAAAWSLRPITQRVGVPFSIREQMADLGYALSALKRAARGEALPGAVLAAIERRLPDVAKALDDILAMSPQQFDKELATFSREIWQQLKITSQEFKQTLIKIRNSPITAANPVRASEIDKTFAFYNVANKDRLKMLTQFYKQLSKEKAAEFKTLIGETTKSLEQLKPEWWAARSAYTRAMELARQPAIGMGYLPEPFAGGKQYTQDFIQAFNKYFERQGGIGAFKVTSEMAGILRITKASLDVSAISIQGMPSFGLAFSHLLWNPVEGMKLMAGWFKGFGMSALVYVDPQIAARLIAKNRTSVMQRLAFGGSEMASDYLISAESTLAERIAKLPFYDRANLSFCTATEVVRDEFWKILSPKAIRQGKGFELARTLDRITGVFNSEAAGIPLTVRQLENSFVWFAPNYTRACLSVLADVFRGGLTGAEARKAIGGMIASGAIIYSGVKYAMSSLEGKSHEQAVDDVLEGFGISTDPITGETTWKPSGTFMTIKIGNYNMGFGGFWYGLLRLFGNVLACIESVGDKEPIDLVRIMKNGSINIQDNPFIQWWYNRSSPLVGTGFELATGKDYLGYPIETPKDYALYILTRFEPIWAEQGINSMIPALAKANEVPEGAARAALIPAEILGLRTSAESTWVKFYDGAQKILNTLPEDLLRQYYTTEELEAVLRVQQQGKLQWGMLPDALQATLRTMYPDLEKLYTEAQTDSSLRNSEQWKNWQAQQDEAKQIYYDRLNNLIKRYRNGELTGVDFREAVSEAGQMYGVSLDTIERDPANQVIYNYLNEKQAEGDKYNWTMNQALQEYIDIAFVDYLDANGDDNYDARQEAIDGFIEKWGRSTYEIVRKMYADKKELGGLDPALVQFADDKEKLTEYWRIDPGDSKARAEFRKAHPELDATLALWGYGGKIQTQAAYDMLTRRATELGFDIDKMQLGLPPQSLIQNYFDYWAIEDTTERKQYRKAHPLFDEWGQEAYGWKDIDEQKVAEPIPPEIQKNLDEYNSLPLGNARKQYRREHPEFDAWLVKEKGYKPVTK